MSLPKQIRNLKKLKILSISNNKILQLPKEIGQLSNLEELNIGSNYFTNFPTEIFQLQNLKTLWLSKNKFQNFPVESIKSNFTKLQRFYCYSYQLELNLIDDAIDKVYLDFSKIKGNSRSFLFSDTKDEQKLIDKGFLLKKMDNKLIKNRNKVFISYSHQDKIWLDRVITNLKVLNFEGLEIDLWDDTQIKSGTKWKEAIKNALDAAYIAITLISTSFLSSEFIRKNELPPLLKAANEGGTKILPLILSPCRFTKTKVLSDFQSVNDPNQPLSECDFSKQERILVKLTNDVEEYINAFDANNH